MSNAFRLSLAPDKLWQQIDPWKFYQQGAQFGFINIDLGNTQHPELEQKILDEVGSYGRQLGHTLLPQIRLRGSVALAKHYRLDII
jgi:hypothetical protein